MDYYENQRTTNKQIRHHRTSRSFNVDWMGVVMRVAVYARVSTTKETQNPETQLLPLREYAKRNDDTIVEEYVDRKSGRNIKRNGYNKLMKDALYHKFQKIYVWKMDRFSRGKIIDVLNVLEKLKGYGIDVESITEPFLNTNNPTWDLILSILSWSANQESKRISERVSAGAYRYKKEHGKHWKEKEWNVDKAIKLRRQGVGWRSIEKELRADGDDISWAGIRHRLLQMDEFNKGDNIPIKKESIKKTSN